MISSFLPTFLFTTVFCSKSNLSLYEGMNERLCTNSHRGLVPGESNGSKRPNSTNRTCAVCKKNPIQVQCLHCSQSVCLICAGQHVNLVAQETDSVGYFLNEKLNALNCIAAHTKQRIIIEHDKIVQQAEVERDRAVALLTQMIDDEKEKLHNKNKELKTLPWNEIPGFTHQLQSELEYLTDENENFFEVKSSISHITLQRRNEPINTRQSAFSLVCRSRSDTDARHPKERSIIRQEQRMRKHGKSNDNDDEN